MSTNHIPLEDLAYRKPVLAWLVDRYGVDEAASIWKKVQENYAAYLADAPDYGGKKNGHSQAIYGGLLIFALVPALPDEPSTEELEELTRNVFMAPFVKLGKVVDLNRSAFMWLIDNVFHRVAKRDQRDIEKWPAGFVNEAEPYDRENRASRYRFTQCPNAEFAKAHGLLHVLPLLCNCDFFGIEQIHGKLIRCGTCGNADQCDYLVVGSESALAAEWETVRDDAGFLVSRKK